jgi:hypothetical protein
MEESSIHHIKKEGDMELRIEQAKEKEHHKRVRKKSGISALAPSKALSPTSAGAERVSRGIVRLGAEAFAVGRDGDKDGDEDGDDYDEGDWDEDEYEDGDWDVRDDFGDEGEVIGRSTEAHRIEAIAMAKVIRDDDWWKMSRMYRVKPLSTSITTSQHIILETHNALYFVR